eukprot:4387029-Pyramimonas_sp.AAC.1
MLVVVGVVVVIEITPVRPYLEVRAPRKAAFVAMLCCAMLCHAMLRHAMLCYAVLCYAALCYAMLH